MKVELIIPIDSLRGKLRQDGFYFRKYRGQQIVQKCPDRSKHVKTEDEAANQRRFAAKYAGYNLRPRNRRKAEKSAKKNGMRLRMSFFCSTFARILPKWQFRRVWHAI